MSAQVVAINRETWRRCGGSARRFAASEVGGKAKAMFGLLVALLLAVNGVNVVSSYVGRDFMTAIEQRNMPEVVRWAVLYIGVFAVSTVVAVVYRFTEERLALLWREWLTWRLVQVYLSERTYYRLDAAGAIANPDQRIAEDVRTFTTTTLSFTLILLNSLLAVVAFSGVLWSISPLLFVIAVLCAAGGSALIMVLGRPLVGLNYDQLDKEAAFRANLIHVSENAESVALVHHEGRLQGRLSRHFDALVANLRRIITVNRNLGYFTTGYYYLYQIVPALVVAPLFIRGEVEFGVITQSTMAFTHLLGAFSLVVGNIQPLSSFAAVVARLSALGEGIEATGAAGASGLGIPCDTQVVGSPAAGPGGSIEISEDPARVAYEGLTLRSPRDGRTLIEGLTVSAPHGMRVLIRGRDASAQVALFRATAGIWYAGAGRIIRPGLDEILFLPERPYLPPGTLRELLLLPQQEHAVPDDRILATLTALDLDRVLARAGGLDVERDWDDILSLDEQQLLAAARVLHAAPRFAFLDRPATALSPAQEERVLQLLSARSISYVTITETDEPTDRYDAVLDLTGGGAWTWSQIPP
jgi:vitamin B12/bleomycin/antimicrobial peptide transport system ATP-binding/permease protein